MTQILAAAIVSFFAWKFALPGLPCKFNCQIIIFKSIHFYFLCANLVTPNSSVQFVFKSSLLQLPQKISLVPFPVSFNSLIMFGSFSFTALAAPAVLPCWFQLPNHLKPPQRVFVCIWAQPNSSGLFYFWNFTLSACSTLCHAPLSKFSPVPSGLPSHFQSLKYIWSLLLELPYANSPTATPITLSSCFSWIWFVISL